MPARQSKREKDVFQIAKSVLDTALANADENKPKEKNPAAVALGKLGASDGGKARAAKLTAARRKAIAKKAARARWSKRANQPPAE